MERIDTTDRRILEILQENARTPNAEIARRLDMAASAIHERIRKLEERGVIRGYGVRLDPTSVGAALVAFVLLRTDEKLGDQQVCGALAEMPEVLEVHDIAGEDCYLVKVRVRDTTHLHRLLRGRIAEIELVRSTRSIIVLETFKETEQLPLLGNGDSP